MPVLPKQFVFILIGVSLFAVLGFVFAPHIFAAWVDAPGSPPGYGTIGCTYPCLEDDFKPVNLSATAQTKAGDLGALHFCLGTDCISSWPGGTGSGTAAGYWTSTVTGNDIYNNNSGNVGIGTPSPTAGKLVVSGSYPQLVLTNPSAGSGSSVKFQDNGTDAGAIGHMNTVGGLQFSGINASTPHMIILSGGNVGIGTPSPQSKLNILPGGTSFTVPVHGEFGSATSNRLLLHGSEPGIMLSSDYVNSQTGTEARMLGMQIGVYAPGDNRPQIYYGGQSLEFVQTQPNGSTLNRRMIIDLAGNVGIGSTGSPITTPSILFDVAGSMSASAFFDRDNSAGSYYLDPASSSNSGVLAGMLAAAGLNTGTLRVTGGSGTANQVLTSDVSGNATWQTPAVGGGGTVTSLSQGTGIALSPTTITGAGTIAVDSTVCRTSGNCPGSSYSAGAGLSLSGTTFSLNTANANTWSANQAFSGFTTLSGGMVTNAGSATSYFQAPIFYDSDNSVYYVDPQGTSSLGGISVAGNASLGGNLTVGNNATVSNNFQVTNGTTRYRMYVPTSTVLYSAPTERSLGGANCVYSNNLKLFGAPGAGRYRIQFDKRSSDASDYVWASITCDGTLCSPEAYLGNSTTYQTYIIDMNTPSAGGEIELYVRVAETSGGSCSNTQLIYIRNVYLMGTLTTTPTIGTLID